MKSTLEIFNLVDKLIHDKAPADNPISKLGPLDHYLRQYGLSRTEYQLAIEYLTTRLKQLSKKKGDAE